MALRVGILTYDFHPHIGGQGRVTYDLWRQLRHRHDIDVRVISPARNELTGHLTRAAVTHRWGRHPLFSVVATLRARAWVRPLDLDVLHVNGGPGGVLYLGSMDVPVVYSLFHTYEQVVRHMSGHGWKASAIRLERAAYGGAARLIASTSSTEASLRRIGLTVPTDAIPCGVSFDAFPRGEMQRDEDIVLFVGRLDHRKDPILLVHAFARVAARRPGARLVIVGVGPLEPQLRALVTSLGLEAAVRFERFVGHDTLVRWYQRATVVAVPSVFEGFGLSAVEAQSCGACVVATDSDGLRDVIQDGQTGLLAAREPGALSDSLLLALEDPALRARLGTAAAHHVREAYRWDRIVDRYAAAYAGVARA